MPYITAEQRQKIDKGDLPSDAGELNYNITRLIHRYLDAKGQRYATFNEIMGVLSCVAAEFYRRWAIPYEDRKIRENGDVAPQITQKTTSN